ncbi:MAG: TIGR01212 family radical SAM protein [Planctomycetes bacterium]|nr:TIGR01212 family radical SAM protein [Planctomycetota bacterium]
MNENAVDLPFRTLVPWLVERYGRPVHRVALDAGSSCPNRDGTKGFGGCTYCDVEGSGTGALKSGADLARQLEVGLKRIARRDPDVGAIAYFQSYSNTYVPIARLREVLAVVEARLGSTHPPIVAVSVATRPDTLSEDALDVLAELARKTDVWIELGLETADDAVQRAIRRFHTLRDFEDAAARVKARGLLLVGHAILGLPGDGREGARRTAQALAAAGCDGVKVHHLMILRRTQMEKAWRNGELEVLDEVTYVSWLADFVELLAPEQILHRINGDSPAEDLLAPHWAAHKNDLRARLVAEFARRGTRQGSTHSPVNAAARVSET